MPRRSILPALCRASSVAIVVTVAMLSTACATMRDSGRPHCQTRKNCQAGEDGETCNNNGYICHGTIEAHKKYCADGKCSRRHKAVGNANGEPCSCQLAACKCKFTQCTCHPYKP